MEKFQSRVIYKGLSQFTGNSTTKSIVTLVARLRFCFPQTKKKGGRGGVVKEREKQKKKKKRTEKEGNLSTVHGSPFYSSRSSRV